MEKDYFKFRRDPTALTALNRVIRQEDTAQTRKRRAAFQASFGRDAQKPIDTKDSDLASPEYLAAWGSSVFEPSKLIGSSRLRHLRRQAMYLAKTGTK